MKHNVSLLLIAIFCSLSCGNAFSVNKFTGTCSGATIEHRETGTTNYNTYCCSATVTEDFTNDGYARGFEEPDGRVSCCLDIECPNGRYTTVNGENFCASHYNSNDYYVYGNHTMSAYDAVLRKCVNINGQNILKCDSMEVYRDGATFSENGSTKEYWGCSACTGPGYSVPSGSSYIYKDEATAITGNQSLQDCRAKQTTTDTRCKDDKVETYYKKPDDATTMYSNWIVYNRVFEAKAGYRKDYTNGQCEECDDGTYSFGGNVNYCLNPPLHADANSDHTDFICEAGTYRSDNACYGCPMSSDFIGIDTTYMTSDDGATSVTQCFIDHTDDTTGQITGNDGTGTWKLSSNCYYAGGEQRVHLVWASGASNDQDCSNAVSDFCSNYLGATGNATGTCANNIFNGWNTQDIKAFYDFFDQAVFMHGCHNYLQSVSTYTN